MSRNSENQGFKCGECGSAIFPLKNGSYRNHCPFCLYSLHVDIQPGDRNNTCRGLMKPIGVKKTSKKGMQIIHECTICKGISVNKIAENDLQPDDIDGILKLM